MPDAFGPIKKVRRARLAPVDLKFFQFWSSTRLTYMVLLFARWEQQWFSNARIGATFDAVHAVEWGRSNRRSASGTPTALKVTTPTTPPSSFGWSALGHPSCNATAGLDCAMRQVG